VLHQQYELPYCEQGLLGKFKGFRPLQAIVHRCTGLYLLQNRVAHCP